MLTPFQEYSFRFLRLIQIVGSARPHFIDKFINIRPTHSQGKLRAIFALSFPTMSYIYKFIDRALHQPTQKYPSSYGMVPAPSRNAIGSYTADERMTPRPLISRPERSTRIPGSVLLEAWKGEHAEDLTAGSQIFSMLTLPGVQLPLPPAHPDRRKCTTPFSSINL